MGNSQSSYENQMPKKSEKSETLAPDKISTYDDSIYMTKVVLFSKPDLQGNMYLMSLGNYTSTTFIKHISPDNIFSLSIPPETSVKLFCGDMYDYGGKGSTHITNVLKEPITVMRLPQHIQGMIRSVSVSRQRYEDENTIKTSNIGLQNDMIENFGTFDSLKLSNFSNKYMNNSMSDNISKMIQKELFGYFKLLLLLVVVVWIASVFITPPLQKSPPKLS